ncbi:MAG: peptidoglycan endopeptidase [Paraburkholderia sp.]|uniref:C40 family peptidase n=1 Tax=Paraburkholderia sp. TaxID=1926495 RepID=UPI00120C23D3|nr:C40 family peptidase [Paraburkholderia sp.]TAL94512.1 MAG: peptidoglycan endopeptidase [Paraburkholderia sp.]
MRRTGFSLLIVLLLAACSGVPQKTTRGPASSATSSAGAYRTIPPGFPNFVDHTVGREEISIQAMSLVGVPYRWGGNTPDSGFDCSGLVRYVVSRAASVNLPRTTADMSSRGESVEPDEIATGDLIFFNTTGRPHSHVGIYVGKLRFVNAPSTGGTVRIDYLTNPYWAKRFDGIRRVAPPASKPAPFDTPTYQASATPESSGPAGLQTASRPAPAQPGYGAGISSLAGGTSTAPLTRTVVSTPRSTQPAAPAATFATATPPAALAAVPAAPRPASADPFEPPPPGMTAAQMQARAAGATSPAAISGAAQVQAAYAPLQSDVSTSSRPPLASSTATPAPDAIDAAADAFEPPPPAAVAARQAQQAQQEAGQIQQPSQPDADDGVRIMRASTASRPLPAPTQSGDDPIARFANGSF